MTIQEAKQIRIADYLQSLGYTPVKRQDSSLWYKSPLREEAEASFKVNTELNQWYDFGIGKGGNIIALASELYRSDNVPYLLECIAKQTPHLHTAIHVPFSFGRQSVSEPMYRHLQVSELSSPVLLSYLQERGISTELAKRECKELHFENKGRPYFAIGFPNMAGGYEVRNRYFKGCVAPKGHHPYPTKWRTADNLLSFRGLHGLPLVPFHPCEEQSAMPPTDHAGLYHLELRFQSRKGGGHIG